MQLIPYGDKWRLYHHYCTIPVIVEFQGKEMNYKLHTYVTLGGDLEDGGEIILFPVSMMGEREINVSLGRDFLVKIGHEEKVFTFRRDENKDINANIILANFY